jgi:iron(III) transport system ATP-binding protein
VNQSPTSASTVAAGHAALPDVALTVDRLSKNFSGHEKTPLFRRRGPGPQSRAVRGVSFVVPEGQLFTLLGPSGCGKTTTLRSIAGLEQPDSGVITIGGRELFNAEGGVNVPTEQRGLGMVFQSYAIWPHMTVFDNVAFPLRMGPRRERVSGQALRARVLEALESVGLGQYSDRFATALSGGQQQRLALARGLVVQPRVLLLDEPLSNLDAQLRESMRVELKRMQRSAGVTAIYVTHDQTEALSMSDLIAVMKDGRLVQLGTPTDIYQRPNCRFVAEFIGSCNLIDGTVRSVAPDATVVATADAELVAAGSAPPGIAPGDPVIAAVRPEVLSVAPATAERPGGPDVWRGVVVNRAFQGECVTFSVQVGERTMTCRADPVTGIAVGDEVWLAVPPARQLLVADPPEDRAPEPEQT